MLSADVHRIAAFLQQPDKGSENLLQGNILQVDELMYLSVSVFFGLVISPICTQYFQNAPLIFQNMAPAPTAANESSLARSSLKQQVVALL